MYRQILICPEDQNFQLILWRNCKTSPHLRRQKFTLSRYTLRQLAADKGQEFPLPSNAILDHIYIK